MSRLWSFILVLTCGVLVQGCSTEAPDVGQTGPAPAAANEPAPDVAHGLAEILAGDHRSEQNRARDVYRHPRETLEFFGLTEEMSVVEIWPAGGWYTEVIASYVNENGQYYAAHWDPKSEVEFIQRAIKAYQDKLAERPDLYGNVEMTVLMFPDQFEIASPESVDMVVTFRNIHNWMAREAEAEVFAAMYAALKPGGVLGVVEHRGNPELPQDPKAESGYVNQGFAIELAERAGFVLDATSEINANPADTKDYEAGVWTLPPTLRLQEQDQDRYLAIGESDRFTLRFVKPAA